MPFYILFLVPSMRLELTRLSALPPQDSVSTNSTTTAANAKLYRALNHSTSEFDWLSSHLHLPVQVRSTAPALRPPVLPPWPGLAPGSLRATVPSACRKPRLLALPAPPVPT